MVLSETRSCSSSEMGDHIGMESCVDTEDQDSMFNERIIHDRTAAARRRNRRWDRAGGGREGKEYPPPIPWLARTENLPSHMPWVMRRYHTSDGRLVIREERVRHHEYFRAHRSDGRLTLHLVPLDHDGDPGDQLCVTDSDEEREEEEEEEEDGVINENRGGGDVINEDGVLGGGDGMEEGDRTVMIGGGGGKCYSTTGSPSSGACNSVRKSSCLVGNGMVVPAIRPVHI